MTVTYMPALHNNVTFALGFNRDARNYYLRPVDGDAHNMRRAEKTIAKQVFSALGAAATAVKMWDKPPKDDD